MPRGQESIRIVPSSVNVVSADADATEAQQVNIEIPTLATARAGGTAVNSVGAREDEPPRSPSHFKSAITAISATERSKEGQRKLARQPSVMANATRRATNFKLGQRFFDESHGRCTVVGLTDGDVSVKFDSDGVERHYSLSNQRKLKPVIEDTHAYSANDLFDLVDTDSSGLVDKNEFAYLHKMVVEGEARHAEKVAAAKRSEAEQRRGKRMMKKGLIAISLMLSTLLLFSVASNVVAIWLIVDKQVPTTTADTVLLAKGTNNPVRVAEASFGAPLSSYLPDSALDALHYFTAESATGAKVHVQVEGYMRLAAQKCRPPIVKFITPVGTVLLEGTELFFDTAIAPVFLEAGFVTHGLAAGEGSADGRRKLSLAKLRGFFDTLENYAEAANTTVCIPDLPSVPTRFIGHSKALQICGAPCEDEYGFVEHGLAGTTTIKGRVYSVEEKFTIDRQIGELVLEKTVTRYPRYPELRVVTLSNGTHSMDYTEYDGKFYHCHFNAGFPNTVNNDTSGETIHYKDGSDGASLDLQIRYEGFTWYSSDIHHDVPSVKYAMEMLQGMELHEFYATALNPNKPFGVQAYSYNNDTLQYELTNRVDFFDHRVNAEVDEDEVDVRHFEMIDPALCWPPSSKTHGPPDPALEPIGPGVVRSGEGHEPVWGSPRSTTAHPTSRTSQPSPSSTGSPVSTGSGGAPSTNGRALSLVETVTDAVMSDAGMSTGLLSFHAVKTMMTGMGAAEKAAYVAGGAWMADAGADATMDAFDSATEQAGTEQGMNTQFYCVNFFSTGFKVCFDETPCLGIYSGGLWPNPVAGPVYVEGEIQACFAGLTTLPGSEVDPVFGGRRLTSAGANANMTGASLAVSDADGPRTLASQKPHDVKTTGRALTEQTFSVQPGWRCYCGVNSNLYISAAGQFWDQVQNGDLSGCETTCGESAECGGFYTFHVGSFHRCFYQTTTTCASSSASSMFSCYSKIPIPPSSPSPTPPPLSPMQTFTVTEDYNCGTTGIFCTVIFLGLPGAAASISLVVEGQCWDEAPPDDLSICETTCGQSAECAGFVYYSSTGRCYYRRSTTCGGAASANTRCFTKNPWPSPPPLPPLAPPPSPPPLQTFSVQDNWVCNCPDDYLYISNVPDRLPADRKWDSASLPSADGPSICEITCGRSPWCNGFMYKKQYQQCFYQRTTSCTTGTANTNFACYTKNPWPSPSPPPILPFTVTEDYWCGSGTGCSTSDLGHSPHAFISLVVEGRRWDVAPPDDLSICETTCGHSALCAGFAYHTTHGRCYYRRSTTCGGYASANNKCFTKSPSPPPPSTPPQMPQASFTLSANTLCGNVQLGLECSEANNALVGGGAFVGSRHYDPATRDDVSTCKQACSNAGSRCGGFFFNVADQACWYRVSAECNVIATSTTDVGDCYVKNPAPPVPPALPSPPGSPPATPAPPHPPPMPPHNPEEGFFEELASTSCGGGSGCDDDNNLFIGENGDDWDLAPSLAGGVLDVQHCKIACGSTPECGGFVFGAEAQRCVYRKNAECGHYSPSLNTCFVKIPWPSPPPAPPSPPFTPPQPPLPLTNWNDIPGKRCGNSGNCPQENSDFIGHDGETWDFSSRTNVYNCRRTCESSDTCGGFFWADGKCHYKKVICNVYTPSFAADCYENIPQSPDPPSAPHPPSPPPAPPLALAPVNKAVDQYCGYGGDCPADNDVFIGDGDHSSGLSRWDHATRDDVYKCHARCQSSSKCMGFVFRQADSKCYYRKSICNVVANPGNDCYAKRMPLQVSVNMACGNQGGECPSNNVVNIGDGGNSWDVADRDDVALCLQRCYESAECSGFFVDGNSQKCHYRKNAHCRCNAVSHRDTWAKPLEGPVTVGNAQLGFYAQGYIQATVGCMSVLATLKYGGSGASAIRMREKLCNALKIANFFEGGISATTDFSIAGPNGAKVLSGCDTNYLMDVRKAAITIAGWLTFQINILGGQILAQARLDIMLPFLWGGTDRHDGSPDQKLQAFIRIRISLRVKFLWFIDKTFQLNILPGNNKPISCSGKVYEVEFPSFNAWTNDESLMGPQKVKLIKFGGG